MKRLTKDLPRWIWLFAGVLVVLAVLFFRRLELFYLSSVMVYAGLFWLFARTLRPGRQPLISALAARFHGSLSPQSVIYTRRVTQAWTLLFAVILLELILLAIFAPHASWSLYANLINAAVVVIFFIAEFRLRRWFVKDVKHMRFFELLRFLKQTRLSSEG